MPITRSTSGVRSRAEMKARPISPVGPVTATVSMRRFSRNGKRGDGRRIPVAVRRRRRRSRSASRDRASPWRSGCRAESSEPELSRRSSGPRPGRPSLFARSRQPRRRQGHKPVRKRRRKESIQHPFRIAEVDADAWHAPSRPRSHGVRK